MSPSLISLVLVGALLGSTIVAPSLCNGLVRSQKRVQEAWSGIDVQLRRRASLLPNLMEIVRGYAEHECEVFEPVSRSRGALQKSTGAGEAASANNLLTQALGRLFALVENYPQLPASDNFTNLHRDLLDTEEKIAFARQFYNRNVLDYNTRIETYPTAVVARFFDFAPSEFFEISDDARAEVRMSFVRLGTPPEPQATPPAA
jgi:LemA protein